MDSRETWKGVLAKASSKLLSFERDNSWIYIPIGYNSVWTSVLKRQYFIAVFPAYFEEPH